MKTLFRSLWLTLVMALVVAPAFAQNKTIREELPEKIRPTWDAAGELFEAANYEAALVQYQAVYKESANPRVLHNIAVCWKERKFYAQAVGAWEKQLAKKEKLPQKEIDRANESLTIVRPFVSTLELESNQAGATLFIKDLEIGTTPLLGSIPVDVGPNKIVLEKKGYARVERTVEVEKGKGLKLTLNMIKAEATAPARISVTGAEGAQIWINGVDMGPAPFEGEVPTGRTTFEARLKGYRPSNQTSMVVAGEPVAITLALEKSLNEGKVRIRTGTKDALIKIDDKLVGQGTWEGILPAGGHQLEVTKDGYITHRDEITLLPDQERVIKVHLDEDKSSAWIYWVVTGIAVAAGAGITSYFVLRPAEGSEVTGTFDPGVVPTIFSF